MAKSFPFSLYPYKKKLLRELSVQNEMKNSSKIRLFILAYVFNLDCPKTALSSQTKKVISNTTFSHCLGQNHYKKPKIEKSYQFFNPANGVQSFTT